MEDNLKELKQEYKQKKKEANSKEEIQHIKHDYKEMKNTLKDVNKMIKENDLLEPVEDFMKRFDFKTFEETQINNSIPDLKMDKKNDKIQENSIEERKPKYSKEDIDKLISDIDKKIEELDKKENN